MSRPRDPEKAFFERATLSAQKRERVGLIVGVVIGGLLCLALLFLAVCCCCWCYRKKHPRASQTGFVIRYPGTANVTMSTTSTTDATPPPRPVHTPSGPGIYQPPPSYEVVIRQYGGHHERCPQIDTDATPSLHPLHTPSEPGEFQPPPSYEVVIRQYGGQHERCHQTVV